MPINQIFPTFMEGMPSAPECSEVESLLDTSVELLSEIISDKVKKKIAVIDTDDDCKLTSYILLDFHLVLDDSEFSLSLC